jgi:ABC-type multidrug transport system ATPase subunit
VRKRVTGDDKLKRSKKKTILLNSHESQALDKYFKKYKISNQSKFMRETIMKVVLKKFSDDYPTLWDQPGVPLQAGYRL